MSANARPLDGLQGLVGWLTHRLWANWWSLAVGAVLLAPLAAYAMLSLDREGLTNWIAEADLEPVASAGSAQEALSVAVGIDAAFLTLYFSISLLVLTIAASNLGVRLIDRWLERTITRVSIAGLSFVLLFSLFALAAVDPDADVADLPLGTILAAFALQLVNLGMLAVALHDLGRTMFVDRAIAAIAEDASTADLQLVPCRKSGIEWQVALSAPRDGYIEGADVARIAELLGDHRGRIRLCAAPGQYVFAGDTLLGTEHELDAHESIARRLHRAIPIGDYRTDAQGPVYRVRLLVEIAARALSPAVNDFYTAMASADHIASVLGDFGDRWAADGEVSCYRDDERIELVDRDFRALFDAPLQAFRQSAASYPPVALALIGHYGALACRFERDGKPDGLSAYLRGLAEDLANHALDEAGHDRDRTDLRAARDRAVRSGT